MKKILVAEDNPANRELIRAMLESRGYEVVEADDGEDALLKTRETAPDLVLMDVQMPRLDGVGALQRMRREPGLASIPVIALTAYAMRGDREQFLAAGFDGYLSKPIEARALWGQVQTLLRRDGAA
jgi:two-component system, cell cycle response regulator DivK